MSSCTSWFRFFGNIIPKMTQNVKPCYVLFATPLYSFVATGKKRKPNIIFTLADDMGWGDSTVYGSKFYESPNIERLAKKGMRFSSAYAANPLCSPTRASILTGQYQCRIGITTPNCHISPAQTNTFLSTSAPTTSKRLEPVTKNRLELEYFTTGEALKEAVMKLLYTGNGI